MICFDVLLSWYFSRDFSVAFLSFAKCWFVAVLLCSRCFDSSPCFGNSKCTVQGTCECRFTIAGRLCKVDCFDEPESEVCSNCFQDPSGEGCLQCHKDLNATDCPWNFGVGANWYKHWYNKLYDNGHHERYATAQPCRWYWNKCDADFAGNSGLREKRKTPTTKVARCIPSRTRLLSLHKYSNRSEKKKPHLVITHRETSF